MENNYFLLSHIGKKELVLVTVLIDKRITKKRIVSNNNVFSFDIEKSTDYFYFLIGKTKSDYLYPNSLSNKYELSFNNKINSYTISVFNEFEPGIFEEYSINNDQLLPKYIKNQKFWTYIPKNIDKNKKLGLIISFDGQNAFFHGKYKNKNIYQGTQLDIIADILSNKYHKNYMILGIDNGHKYRSKELTMSSNFGELQFDKLKNTNNDFNDGFLEEYMEFIIKRIIPQIESKYNIEKSSIGIIGESSGGLASYYSLIKYPSLFSFGLILSPAFPFFKKDDLLTFYKNNILNKNKRPKIYLYSGNITNLEKNICKSTLDLYDNLRMFQQINLRINYQAKHNEVAWRIAINEGIKKVLLED